MSRFILVCALIGFLVSCRSTRNIQTAIAKKDTTTMVARPDSSKKIDTLEKIKAALQAIRHNQINYQTFSSKIGVEYRGGDEKNYNVNANVRMYKDSVIWINVNGPLGFDVMRVLITSDSVKLLDKLNKTYTARSVDYLQEVTALPLDLPTVQNLIVGNAVFLDSNIVAYSSTNDLVSLLSLGEWFKNLITLNAADKTILHSKLDDADNSRNRTAELSYSDYENKKGFPFSTKRQISVVEKKRLDIKLDIKQYDFNREVSFPFSIPKNYDRN
ncbi:MAG: DUF4292 domain-containing protein [Flavisolibacter sp.]